MSQFLFFTFSFTQSARRARKEWMFLARSELSSVQAFDNITKSCSYDHLLRAPMNLLKLRESKCYVKVLSCLM